MEDTVTDEEKTEQDEPLEPAEGEHHLKEELRGAVAKAVGIAIEAGSMLSGHAGEMVSAQGQVAEEQTEELIDRIDGEG
jgi:hypothetical protein